MQMGGSILKELENEGLLHMRGFKGAERRGLDSEDCLMEPSTVRRLCHTCPVPRQPPAPRGLRTLGMLLERVRNKIFHINLNSNSHLFK